MNDIKVIQAVSAGTPLTAMQLQKILNIPHARVASLLQHMRKQGKIKTVKIEKTWVWVMPNHTSTHEVNVVAPVIPKSKKERVDFLSTVFNNWGRQSHEASQTNTDS